MDAWNPVEEAVWLVGGPTRASIICQCSFHSVRKWRKRGTVTDATYATRLSEATKGAFTVRQLCGLDGPDGTPLPAPDVGPMARRANA